jgi:hypothetical protein
MKRITVIALVTVIRAQACRPKDDRGEFGL